MSLLTSDFLLRVFGFLLGGNSTVYLPNNHSSYIIHELKKKKSKKILEGNVTGGRGIIGIILTILMGRCCLAKSPGF